jgi:elongation factor P--beta-lysine ligase
MVSFCDLSNENKEELRKLIEKIKRKLINDKELEFYYDFLITTIIEKKISNSPMLLKDYEIIQKIIKLNGLDS